MTKVQLQAQLISEKDGKAQVIRKAGFIPAIMYGASAANKSIKVKKHDFAKAFKVAGEFNLVDLSVGQDKPVKVIVKDVQRDGLTDNVIHIDFYQVDMAKKILTEIPLHFVGESKAVKDLGGTLVKNMDTVKVSCLPGDLVSHIEVDISKLVEFDNFIRLHDLILPQGVELASATNEAVVGVVETKIEVEAPKPVEAAPVEGEAAAQEPGKEAKGPAAPESSAKPENKKADETKK
ncbi:MAG: 50S ribosomal protein L25 [Patescibacteria group bacterium]|nr:50S ribosomal protein L25 [Patescibacteria group bacterium]